MYGVSVSPENLYVEVSTCCVAAFGDGASEEVSKGEPPSDRDWCPCTKRNQSSQAPHTLTPGEGRGGPQTPTFPAR